MCSVIVFFLIGLRAAGKAVNGRIRVSNQPATVQIGFDGKCTLRVGYIDRGGHTSEDMTLSELAKRMDEVGEREAMRY